MSTSFDKLADEHARLDEIETNWCDLRTAHLTSVTLAGPARNALVLRYNGAIRRFLGVLIHDPHDLDEVAQEMVQRLLRGDFARADPTRGRFRDLLAVAARNLARSYWTRKQRRAARPLLADVPAAPEAESFPQDEEIIANWRAEVLKLTWAELERYQRTHPGSIAFTLLRLRTDHAEDDSEALAARLSRKVARPFRADAMRQQLRRARLRFAELLVQEVANALDQPTPDDIEEELIALGLMEYVRDFLPPDWRTRWGWAS
jgi:hypothetical protein